MLVPFQPVKTEFIKHFSKLKDRALFTVEVEGDTLWNLYLESFPSELRNQFQCSSCKYFIKNYGGIVVINNDYTLESIWNFEVEEPFKSVVEKLHNLVVSSSIGNVLRTISTKLGTDSNTQLLESGEVIRWHHFYLEVPKSYVVRKGESLEGARAPFKDNQVLMKRALSELSPLATDTVLELIAQGSLYRGEEYKGLLLSFKALQEEYHQLDEKQKDVFCWVKSDTAISRIRNSAVGTLLIDISNGMDLDSAVTRFEKVMAPENYKRPQAIFTQRMLEDAQKKIEELGLTNSLYRRLAISSDITINDVLFVDRKLTSIGGDSSIFNVLSKDVKVEPKDFSRNTEITLDEFLHNVLPTASSIELYLENKHEPKLVTLIAPVYDSPSITKWGNNFTWSYNNALADASLKDKVKKAGGAIEGELRASLEWYNYDDLDIHLHLPNGEHIYFSNKRSRNGGTLDVDENAGSKRKRSPVENIIFSNKGSMLEGKYVLSVHNFSKRESIDVGFYTEIECQGQLYGFTYDKPVRNNETITVATFTYSKTKGVTIINSLPFKPISKDVWGLPTNNFHKVSMIMHSPNHWDNSSHISNKHTFLMLEGAKNDGIIRGFFNEYLKEDLVKNHKQVFEALFSRMTVEKTGQELSGVGFSSTAGGSFIVRVTGATTRTLTVNV
jgi:hypothetical protein